MRLIDALDDAGGCSRMVVPPAKGWKTAGDLPSLTGR